MNFNVKGKWRCQLSTCLEPKRQARHVQVARPAHRSKDTRANHCCRREGAQDKQPLSSPAHQQQSSPFGKQMPRGGQRLQLPASRSSSGARIARRGRRRGDVVNAVRVERAPMVRHDRSVCRHRFDPKTVSLGLGRVCIALIMSLDDRG